VKRAQCRLSHTVEVKLGKERLSIVEALVMAQPDALLEELVRTLCRTNRGECTTMQRAVCRPVQRQKNIHCPEQDSQRVKDLRFAHRQSFTIDPAT